MRNFQEEILSLAKEKDITKLGLREIGREIGIINPQTVKYYIQKLEKSGLLNYFKKRSLVKEIYKESVGSIFFINVPILGEANCGEANIFSNESNMGTLKLSPSMLIKTNDIFSLKACLRVNIKILLE